MLKPKNEHYKFFRSGFCSIATPTKRRRGGKKCPPTLLQFLQSVENVLQFFPISATFFWISDHCMFCCPRVVRLPAKKRTIFKGGKMYSILKRNPIANSDFRTLNEADIKIGVEENRLEPFSSGKHSSFLSISTKKEEIFAFNFRQRILCLEKVFFSHFHAFFSLPFRNYFNPFSLNTEKKSIFRKHVWMNSDFWTRKGPKFINIIKRQKL